MSKQLHDAIRRISLQCVRVHNESADGFETRERAWQEGAVSMRIAAAALALTFRAGRPWKATEEQVAEHGDDADYQAWLAWWDATKGTGMRTFGELYELCCGLAGSPPRPAAGIISDFIGECWERGSPPTPEEIEPFFSPKVRGLVWEQKGSHHWTAESHRDTYHIYDYSDQQPMHGNFYWYAAAAVGGYVDALELAQAAAQSHWESRAMEFWREAFE
jgi:hypothetical protein